MESKLSKNNVFEVAKTLETQLSQQEHIINRLGYKVKARDEYGVWLQVIIIPDDNGTSTKVKTEYFFTGLVEFDYISSSLLEFLIKKYLPKTVLSYAKGISLVTSELVQGCDIKLAFTKALKNIKNDNELIAIKTLSTWLIMFEFDAYDFDFHDSLQRISRGSDRNSYINLFTLDAELGPFVQEEMAILHGAIHNPHIHLEDRVILSLLVYFGLRPIQISLLKQSDFVVNIDTGLCYLKIPRVKQNQEFRRTQFTKRLINDEIAQLFEELIETHNDIHGELELEDPPLIMRRTKTFIGKKHPYRKTLPKDHFYNAKKDYIEKKQANQPYQELYEESGKSDEGHHVSSYSIHLRLRSITDYIPNSPRTGRPFNLFPYRFRYTLGTNAVMEGKTEAEVMDLLDHSQNGSVKHYFRYTHEMNEILNEATNKRVEQQHFVAAWTREGDQTGNIYGEEIVEKKYFTSIGKCQKGAPCVFEPAVACYQCDKFCPNKDADAHKKALETLNERRQEVLETSTGAVIHQFDSAIAGCKAAIAYSEGEQIQFLEVEPDSEAKDDE